MNIFAALRGTGGTKRRKWESAVNDYQQELAKVYAKWSKAMAAELGDAEDEEDYDDALEAGLLLLSAQLVDLGRKNITAGGLTALGKTPPTPQFLDDLSDRVEANTDYIERGLIPAIQDRALLARLDPDIIATGAVAYLGMLAAFDGRVESYAGGMWTAMQEAQGTTAQEAEARVAWQRDEQAKHCDDCLEFGEDEFPGRIYESWDDMMGTTFDRLPGEVECSANCRCSLWVEIDGEWTREGY